jgi:hypothetical protein
MIGKDLKEFDEELFDSGFQVGKEIAEEENDRTMNKFIVEYLSATGWGDTKIKQKDGNYQVHSLMFPWTKFSSDTSFPIFRGIVSGMMSQFEQREIKLTHVEKDDKGGTFSVRAAE